MWPMNAAEFDLSLRGALLATDVHEKLSRVQSLHALCPATPPGYACSPASASIVEPGRPARPILVSPREVEQRKLGTIEGRAILLHAIAHIEFNAINLALDAAYRFRGMPDAYYADWLRVAAEEAYHFQLLADRMAELGFAYGDFRGHNGLWEMALKTAEDVLVRMALVPRLMEARGLDVTPLIQARLRHVGDETSAALLDIILRDEIGHVAIGNRWYRWCCEQRQLDPLATFWSLLHEFDPPRFRDAPNRPARAEAGFQEAELDLLMRFWRGDTPELVV